MAGCDWLSAEDIPAKLKDFKYQLVLVSCKNDICSCCDNSTMINVYAQNLPRICCEINYEIEMILLLIFTFNVLINSKQCHLRLEKYVLYEFLI